MKLPKGGPGNNINGTLKLHLKQLLENFLQFHGKAMDKAPGMARLRPGSWTMHVGATLKRNLGGSPRIITDY